MTDIGRSCVPALCRPTGTYICVKHLAHMSYVICTVTYGGGRGGGGGGGGGERRAPDQSLQIFM